MKDISGHNSRDLVPFGEYTISGERDHAALLSHEIRSFHRHFWRHAGCAPVSGLSILNSGPIPRGDDNLWVYMAISLLGLTGNLFWPRRRSVKAAGLLLLAAASYMQSLEGSRDLRSLQRLDLSRFAADQEQWQSFARRTIEADDQSRFDVCLGLTLGILFAALPAKVVSSLCGTGEAEIFEKPVAPDSHKQAPDA